MRNFYDLVRFEYKKLFKRKSTWVCLTLILISVIISIITSAYGRYWHSESGVSAIEAMQLDKQVMLSKEGDIDETFVKEAIRQNSIMMNDSNNYIVDDSGKHLKNKAYIKYILPYEKAVNIINVVYENNPEFLSTSGFEIFNTNGVSPINKLTAEDASNFYSVVNKSIVRHIGGITELSPEEKEKHLQMLSRVRTPFYNGYAAGYSAFDNLLNIIALIILMAVAICISPIFAYEYQTKTDQILLSSRYGKSIAAYAKIFTGFSFSLIVSVITLSGFIWGLLILHGFNGYNVTLQTINVYSTYPVNMLQAALIAIAVTIFAGILFSMFIMLLSAWCKSPFLVVVISFILLFIPGLIHISPRSRLLYQLLRTFPARTTSFSNIFSEYLFEIWGIVLTPATFYILYSAIASIIMIPLVYKIFKHHQIG